MPTALVNVATVLSDGKAKFMPDVLVAGSGGSIDGLAAALVKFFNTQLGQKTVVRNEPAKKTSSERSRTEDTDESR
jgi:tripartite-type tricarboxylate transporter receptor subunit TctC